MPVYDLGGNDWACFLYIPFFCSANYKSTKIKYQDIQDFGLSQVFQVVLTAVPVYLGEDWNATFFFSSAKFNKFFLFTKKRAWGLPYPIICCILDVTASLQSGCCSDCQDCWIVVCISLTWFRWTDSELCQLHKECPWSRWEACFHS